MPPQINLSQRDTEVAESEALAVPIAGLPVDRGRVLVCGDWLLPPVRLLQREAEAGQRRALAVPSPCQSPVSR